MANGLLCPSAPLYAGSKLLGIVNGDEVDILTTPLAVNDGFIKAANQGKVAEQKFRFVNKCLKNGCGQWADDGCGVIKRVLTAMEERVKDDLPNAAYDPTAGGLHRKALRLAKSVQESNTYRSSSRPFS